MKELSKCRVKNNKTLNSGIPNYNRKNALSFISMLYETNTSFITQSEKIGNFHLKQYII